MRPIPCLNNAPALVLAAGLLAGPAHAAQTDRTPLARLGALADRMYTIGETSASAADMIAAEAKAADDIRAYIADGATDGLLAPEPGKPSPLATAAYLGYPNVVAALLTSPLVRAHVDDADANGITPWIAANFSMKQSAWTCNPAILGDPFRFVPIVVTQPYYLANPEPPYRKTREVLEQAGAHADMAQAKTVWLAQCKNSAATAAAAVGASADLQATVQALGADDLAAYVRHAAKAAQARGQ